VFARRSIITVVMLTALAVLGGCSEEDAIITPVETPGLPFPDTPDKLMENFRTVYETMDLVEFPRLMDPAFVTFLKLTTINAFPDVGPTLDVQEETRIHARMFSRQNVEDPEGMAVQGIQAMAFQTLERRSEWEFSEPGDVMPNTLCAVYDVVILSDRGGIYSMLKTQGGIRFYVGYRDTVVNGRTRPFYRMLGQFDFTYDQKSGGAGTEYVAWGSLKALFR